MAHPERAENPDSGDPQTPSEFEFLPVDAERVGRQSALPAHRRFTVDTGSGQMLSCIAWGSDAPRTTLLHGAGLNAHSWDPTVLSLDEPLLALDLPGHGDSSWYDDAAYIPERLADDVVVVLDERGVGPQQLVGQSLGGLTAIELADKRPDLVRQLVLVDILPAVETPNDAADTASEEPAEPADTDDAAPPKPSLAKIREFMTGQRDFADRDEIIDRAIAFGFGPDRTALTRGVTLNTRQREDGRFEFKHHFAHLRDEQGEPTRDATRKTEHLWPKLAALDVPILLIRGRNGIVSNAQVGEFIRRVPGGDVVELEAGHNVQEDNPVALADLLRSFDQTERRQEATR